MVVIFLTYPLASNLLFSSPGTWPAVPTSAHYTGLILGTNIEADINDVGAVCRGGIGDTNFISDAEVKLNRLEHGVFYHMNGDSNPYKIAYGDVKIVRSGWTSDSLETLEYLTTYIHYSDSSDIGNPGFAAAPTSVQISTAWARDTTWNGTETIWLRNYRMAYTLDVLWATNTATGCSLVIRNIGAAADTIWINALRINWLATE
jgi:hypothetical protein